MKLEITSNPFGLRHLDCARYDRCEPDHWKGNRRHMLIAHNGGCAPTHDPPQTGCESCGYVEETGVADTDLAWAENPAWSPGRGQWLCMECH